jgi:hypothetical protein
MFIRTTIIACVLSTSTLPAATVVSNANLNWQASPPQSTTSYTATIFQDAAATDHTLAWFDFDGTSIKSAGAAVDESSDWYVMNAGEEFSKQAILNGLPSPLVISAVISPPVTVGFEQEFYLGVNTGLGFESGFRNVFGWVLLKPIGGVLTMVDNAVSYDSQGIIVGTTTVVPEPSATAIFVGAALSLVGRRRLLRLARR